MKTSNNSIHLTTKRGIFLRSKKNCPFLWQVMRSLAAMDKLVDVKIINAFSGASIPKGKLCSAEYDYEDTHGGFIGTTWEEHGALFLREHESSLSFFTAEAFCYYLPAFMMVELKEPEVADIIAEGIAFHLTDTPLTKERISLFSREQLLAIVAFFECCAARYNDGVYDLCYSKAADEVRKSINDC